MRTDRPDDVIFENERCRLVVDRACIARSLIDKSTGEECLEPGEEMPLFSVTQERPFNNEIKLIYMNKRITCQANRIRREGGRLIVGFELAPYEAVVRVCETPAYFAFFLDDFIVHSTDYPGILTSLPPASEFRLLQLPVRSRKNFGDWLNVSWDDRTAVNVLAANPRTRIGAEPRRGYSIMSADATSDTGLKKAGAVLIVSRTDQFLDCVGQMEQDFRLPHGVASRRSESINSSVYWTGNINPTNVEEHLRYAKEGGFRLMLIYCSAVFNGSGGYWKNGDYDYRPEYPNGREDLRKMLDRIKAAGILPGFHFLHTHIGLRSRYVTPAADYRLNLTRRFTLSRTLEPEDTVVFVEQNPEGSVMTDGCRVLKFGEELISYEGFSAEKPCCFTGCVRGACQTAASDHPQGLSGGILDISEFGASSVYLDQNTGLQDEIADKIAEIYRAGFRFVYFDGSEGTNAPYDFHIPNAQYRVYQKLSPEPLFAEGAAKAHFSWHMLSGGNAFDIFPPDVFKEKIREFPAKEAPQMARSFTRLNFGWWGFRAPETQPDQFEYGTSRAAAWDCPVTLQTNLEGFRKHPRTEDILEVLRRWEEVRAKKWLTEEQKQSLRNLSQEHILLINEKREFELVPYFPIEQAAGGNPHIRAFSFARNGRNYVVFWHTDGTGQLSLPIAAADILLQKELGGDPVPVQTIGGETVVPAAGRCYLQSRCPMEKLIQAFRTAKLSG